MGTHSGTHDLCQPTTGILSMKKHLAFIHTNIDTDQPNQTSASLTLVKISQIRFSFVPRSFIIERAWAVFTLATVDKILL